MSEEAVTLPEGLHVLHLFFRVARGASLGWRAGEREQKRSALEEAVAEIRAWPRTQLLSFSVVGARAHLGFMLLTPDLGDADAATRRLESHLGPGGLELCGSYLSITELSEYMTTEDEHAQALAAEGLAPGHPEFEAKMNSFRARMTKYRQDRLEPRLPDWPVIGFYPMSKRRGEGNNWYLLDFAERKRLMGGHAKVGRQYAGRVLQLITGSTGLDDWEWGVTLFARSVIDIKSIVYEMRFDEVSARYAEFGPFTIGLQMPIAAVLERLGL